MDTIIGADAAKLAGLQIDLLQKMRSGHVTLSHLEWFNGLTKEERDQLVSGKVVKQQGLLYKVASVQVSGAKRFVVKDCLKAANVGWTGNNFSQLFKDKMEENVAGIVIAVHRLKKASLDAPILTELGDCAEIQLAHLFELLQKQSKGEAGVLLTNGYANIAYIKGNDGNLWAMSARWHSSHGFWVVGADSVGPPSRWDDGDQVLSRDS